MQRRSRFALGAVVGVVVLALFVLQFGLWFHLVNPGEYERGQVTIEDPAGNQLGTVDVRVADTAEKRTIGLSRTDELGPDEGMLFVHDETGKHRYVMRGMDFPLDIIFLNANGTVTKIHHADPAGRWTPEFLMERYSGEAKYVLEVNRGWTNETGVDVYHRVDVSGVVNSSDGGRSPATPTATETQPTPQTPAPDLPTVTVADSNGTELGSVWVRIADNRSERYTGLSETDSLPWDQGMLFVYENEKTRRFVMRNMSFPLDMVFVGANGTVNEIHHAPVPPPGTESGGLESYRGKAQYVLEVNRGWTNETGLDVGDTVRVPASYPTDG